ncbi:hypothetical protein ACJVQT_23190 [Enterobacter huaxiensis]|uniref:hypothetical protein n=1 Tax=Enterobacter huaxiensis TaxID=2494702 RepID=UPI002176101F|nr:hypothetical protein [Enterobacter huaxiensis]MCS5452484.1 hypothetical protein [Enterobacter huaxiensis]
MDTAKLALDNTWKVIGDGTKPVLIEARNGAVDWCSSAAAPADNAPAHKLLQGDAIYLPSGVKPYARQSGTDKNSSGDFSGVVIFTVYP